MLEYLDETRSGEHVPLPLACTLGPEDGPARLRRWQRLHDIAAPVADLSAGQLEVRYQPVEGVGEELAALAAAERECCSFADWHVTTVEGHPVLRVTAIPGAPDDAVEPIAAMFGAARKP